MPGKGWLLVLVCWAALLPGISQAQALSAAPAALLKACAGGHGPGGNSVLPQWPSLAGQPKVFIENQLVLIREGLRDVPQMKEVVAELSDEDIVKLALHFSSRPLRPSATLVDTARAQAGALLSRQLLCGSCHLQDYSGQQQVPRLAGQNEVYLLRTMRQFRDNPGPGRDTIMASTLRGLSDTALEQLAHYLATFKP